MLAHLKNKISRPYSARRALGDRQWLVLFGTQSRRSSKTTIPFENVSWLVQNSLFFEMLKHFWHLPQKVSCDTYKVYWCVFFGVYPVYTSSKLCEFVWTSDMRHFVSKTAFSIVLFIQQLIQLLLPFHFHFFYSSHFRCISSRLHKPFSPYIYISLSPFWERKKEQSFKLQILFQNSSSIFTSRPWTSVTWAFMPIYIYTDFEHWFQYVSTTATTSMTTTTTMTTTTMTTTTTQWLWQLRWLWRLWRLWQLRWLWRWLWRRLWWLWWQLWCSKSNKAFYAEFAQFTAV